MYNQRYNEYPPMNGVGFNHATNMDAGGYFANTNNKEMSNFTLQQHNMHGGNDLMFADGSVPYGLYDQSNFVGTNSLMCGNVQQQDQRMMARAPMLKEPYRNDYPISPYGMPNVYPPQAPRYNNPNMYMNRRMDGAYNHECSYNAGPAIPKTKSLSSSVSEKERRDANRKNSSKVKKGMIDINIETLSSNRQGVSIDLNIGVGN